MPFHGGSRLSEYFLASAIQQASKHVRIVGRINRVARQSGAQCVLQPERSCRVREDLVDGRQLEFGLSFFLHIVLWARWAFNVVDLLTTLALRAPNPRMFRPLWAEPRGAGGGNPNMSPQQPHAE